MYFLLFRIPNGNGDGGLRLVKVGPIYFSLTQFFAKITTKLVWSVFSLFIWLLYNCTFYAWIKPFISTMNPIDLKQQYPRKIPRKCRQDRFRCRFHRKCRQALEQKRQD